ncbi:hypothetical protein [Aporhodopirellula aestuarii]|uniref:Secreted protein n=1 Tax=Aporhodopirellula aestuarii TaxID=2950107 RepID=A0ABT0TZ30_9BACT|nr:hypothetical protein [Aporhodopirellula aestuarii]MCM2369872.1 hypothetical protein [Aporhodopirellula aestuarii]
MLRHCLLLIAFAALPTVAIAQSTAAIGDNTPNRPFSNAITSLSNDRQTNTANTRSSRLKRLPRMYGDSLQTGSLSFSSDAGSGYLQSPTCGAARIGDNNSPIPQDRVYFLYQHFHNAVDSTFGPNSRTQSLDLYTLGFEKTFCSERFSLEMRLPFSSSLAQSDGSVSVTNDSLQSITGVAKAVLLESDDSIFTCGLGISFPVSDCSSQLKVDEVTTGLGGQSAYFSPFVGYAATLSEQTFVNSFAQLMIPSGSEFVEVADSSSSDQGWFRPEEVLVFDISTGLWLFRDENAPISGIAAMLELHYSTTLGDDQTASASTSGNSFDFDLQRFDTLNLTSGLHFEIYRTTARVAAVAPLRDDRFFDAEIHFSLNRNF